MSDYLPFYMGAGGSFPRTINLHREVAAMFKFHSLEMFEFCLTSYPIAFIRNQEEALMLPASIFLL